MTRAVPDHYTSEELVAALDLAYTREHIARNAAAVTTAAEWVAIHNRDGWPVQSPAADADYRKRLYWAAHMPMPVAK